MERRSHVGDDTIANLGVSSFTLTSLDVATHHQNVCFSESGLVYLTGQWESRSCPRGSVGFVHRQCVRGDNGMEWGEEISHCVSDEHRRFETLVRWTYQVNGINPVLATTMIEDANARIRDLVTYSLHGHLYSLVIYAKQERCSMSDLSKHSVVEYSKTNCMQYAMQARVPTSFRLDMWTMVILQNNRFCDDLRQQHPNECSICQSIEVVGEASFIQSETPGVYSVIGLSVLGVSVIVLLIVTRHHIAQFITRKRERKQMIRALNVALTEQTAVSHITPSSVPCSNGVMYVAPQGNMYCMNPLRLGGAVV